MNPNRTIDRTDYDALRGYAGTGPRGDARVDEPAAEEPSQRTRKARRGGRILDRIVLGAAYAVQWVRSRWSSKHEGRS